MPRRRGRTPEIRDVAHVVQCKPREGTDGCATRHEVATAHCAVRRGFGEGGSAGGPGARECRTRGNLGLSSDVSRTTRPSERDGRHRNGASGRSRERVTV